jgi:hypothetical protein
VAGRLQDAEALSADGVAAEIVPGKGADGLVRYVFAKQIHYDGANDEECVLEIVGMGPATSTKAETK